MGKKTLQGPARVLLTHARPFAQPSLRHHPRIRDVSKQTASPLAPCPPRLAASPAFPPSSATDDFPFFPFLPHPYEHPTQSPARTSVTNLLPIAQ